MRLKSENVARYELQATFRLRHNWRTRLLGLRDSDIDDIIIRSVRWTEDGYASGMVGNTLRTRVRMKFKAQYGSIWTMLLFSVLWELVKHWLLDAK